MHEGLRYEQAHTLHCVGRLVISQQPQTHHIQIHVNTFLKYHLGFGSPI